MTDRAKELIARVRELDKAATPGPWIADGYGFETLHPDHQNIDSGSGWREPSNAVGRCSDGEYVENGNAENDAAFIAFSRTALPDVATLAEQAIARAEKAEAELKMLHDDPVAVHLNILRGTLAKPDIRSLLHLHGKEALARWDNAEKAEADLAEARRMLKEAEHGRNDAEHDLVEGISYIRQTSRYVNDDRDCRAAWSWADDLQQRHDARVNARHQAREGKS